MSHPPGCWRTCGADKEMEEFRGCVSDTMNLVVFVSGFEFESKFTSSKYVLAQCEDVMVWRIHTHDKIENAFYWYYVILGL